MSASNSKTSFEDALTKTGFGVYNISMAALSGVTIISFACIFYNTTIVIPLSACELNTTSTQRGMLAAGPVVGSILGAMLWGHVSDRRGRKNVLGASLVAGAAVNAVASLSVSWFMLLALQFIAALIVSGQYSLSMTLLSESVPADRRDLVMLLVTSIFLLSQGLIAVLAIPIAPLTFAYHVPVLNITWNPWRTLLLVYSVPSLLSLLWLSRMQESPKFTYTKGDEHRTLEILRAIHRTNVGAHVEYPVKGLLRKNPEYVSAAQNTNHFILLFKPPLRRNTIIMALLYLLMQVIAFKVWLPTIAQQFMQVVSSDVGSPLTVCQAIASSVTGNSSEENDTGGAVCSLRVSALLIVLFSVIMISIANAFSTLAVSKLGRRNMVMVVTGVCGTSGVLVNLVPSAVLSGLLLVLLLIGVITLGLYTALSVALFPTYLRALALTFIMTSSRIANFVSIQVINYLLANNCEAAFYVFGSLLAFSAVVAWFLPKDSPKYQSRRQKLQDNQT